jgi:uncharacterized protein
MMVLPFLQSLLGGMLIGIAGVILLFFNGRIAGVSGIYWTFLRNPKQTSKALWSGAFVVGLVIGGYFFCSFSPDGYCEVHSTASWIRLVIGGVLVGFGTQLANGCTSGHGICGIGRNSPRGYAATFIFIGIAMLVVFLQHLGGLFR